MNKYASLVKAAAVTLALGVFSNAQATLWTFDDVVSQGGYSLFHDSTGTDIMSGSTYGTITTGSGTFDDMSGIFSGTFTGSTPSDGPMAFSLNTPATPADAKLLFGGDNFLMTPGAALSVVFDQSVGDLTNGFVFFNPGDVMGGGPNSFVDHNDGTATLTLWGATNINPNFPQPMGGSYGLDLKISFTSVPTPPVISLFGLGLMIMGIRRSRKVSVR